MSSHLFRPQPLFPASSEIVQRDYSFRLSAATAVARPWFPCHRQIQAMAATERLGSRNGEALTPNGDCDCSIPEKSAPVLTNVGKSTNVAWHECQVGKLEKQKLLKQKGCVIWITGLSGSGKSTLACGLSRELHALGYLSYVLDGDNIRHGLNKDLSFNAEDRAENIRRIGEVAKLFADAGVICIASLISPYRRDRDACRCMLPDATFIEVYLDIPLEVCESRDAKGLYKLARAGKIKGFTGVDDPYEPPLNCEILVRPIDGVCPSPVIMCKQVISYLDEKGFLEA
ncbi:Adenylyl-sulfate kinase 1, chloroplastic [Apostasia shenzhenica]|uniref:Adenylyl-sulfate kinase n=1 Tax=Apostasia shenzhenica TaxID=1088818 RepID=A0A2I0ADK9_9ASPA|nr:Adenylyl-sulfate kinase 1, chloroplastic [Apostasia shenzhenica]